MNVDIHTLTLDQASKALSTKSLSSKELCSMSIRRAAEAEPKVGALLRLDERDVMRQAETSDSRRASGSPLSEFDGVPIAIKDVICVKGQPCTCASKILEKFVSTYDATVIERLKARGFVLFGRANMDEFAMGSSTENSAFKKTRNPWDLDRVPGGSSGGSAAAVAAGEVCVSLGSDTGGSIRQPASFCGVVGLKPTYGLVSRFGLVAFASSLDQIGPFSRDVLGAAEVLDVIAGYDHRDSTSLPGEAGGHADAVRSFSGDLKGLRVGLPKEYFEVEGLDPAVRQAVESAMSKLAAIGAAPVEVALPRLKYAIAAYYVVATAEASANLARFDGVRYGFRDPDADGVIATYLRSRGHGFGDEVRRRILLGTFVLSSGYYDAYYAKAQKARSLIRSDFVKAFEKCDVILGPCAPTPAVRLGEFASPLQMYLADIYTISANLAGICGVSVPCALSPSGLPIGAQLLGPVFGEKTILKVARAIEATRDVKEFTAKGF